MVAFTRDCAYQYCTLYGNTVQGGLTLRDIAGNTEGGAVPQYRGCLNVAFETVFETVFAKISIGSYAKKESK